NLTDPVWDNAAAHPQTSQFALRGPEGWTDVTCQQFRDSVAELARGIIAAGISPGDRVALMSRTRYEWTLIDYAIWAAGAVTVPIYETSSPEQVQWILADSGAVACFMETDAHAAAAASVRDALPNLTRVWVIDPAVGRSDLDELVAAGAAVP